MYAVIETGGKQYRVEPGQKIKIEKLPAEAGATINFENVLMVSNGDKIQIGTPYLKEGKVSASVVSQGRGEKIRIVKHRRRKHSHKEMGHRQYYTEIEITDIKA
jgi:large subunit ribosomal protein L21